MRLIDADALKKAFYDQECWNFVIGSIIDNAPTVEAYTLLQVKDLVELNQKLIDELEEKPQGKWIFHKDYNESCRYGCNQCGNLTNIPNNFCPNCGAMMQKGGTE